MNQRLSGTGKVPGPRTRTEFVADRSRFAQALEMPTSFRRWRRGRGAAGLALASGLCTVPGARAQAGKPNIVPIVAEDPGWKDAGFNGATDIRTPNLDALAAGGAP